jgi:condensin complex subunit 2
MSQALPKNRNRNGGGSRVSSNARVLSGRRHVSGRHVSRNFNDDDNGDTSDIIHFNENKHTILSNFEEWIRLSTDNKITSKNSWNFALIDYFHDLNVIKDGEKINFQRASATLDGCVKIYLSRVESAATETGKLLSGLSNKLDLNLTGDDETNGDKQSDENDDDDDDDDQNTKRQRKMNRIVESTLVPFDTLKIKKLDQELNIDPLFKKALSEFDEGGAKSLLLNTLNIDSTGRVIFDATTKPADDDSKMQELESMDSQPPIDINLSKIEKIINISNIDNFTLCPSIEEFQNAIEDFSKAKSILNDFNTKYNDDLSVGNDEEPLNEDMNDVMDNGDFGDDYDVDMPDFDNENYNENSTNENNDAINNFNKSILQRVFEEEPENSVHVTTNTQILDRDLMAYFDDRMKTNWQGPEHWKVNALKKSKHLEDVPKVPSKLISEPSKKNQQVIIDFFQLDDVESEDSIFEGPKNPLSIMKKNPEGEDTKLPDDIKYNSSRLTNLFTKSQVSIVYFPNKKQYSNSRDIQPLTDENFFAEQYKEQEEADRLAQSFHQAEYDDFNDDFGGDDGFNDIDFNDALEGNVDEKKIEDADDKNLLLGRRRKDNITFSRVAKRVDIKLLKDNIWKTIKQEPDESNTTKQEEDEEGEEGKKIEDKQQALTKKFASVVNTVGKLYKPETRKELSTSFCFICLLHLANEYGLTINANENNDDLEIVGF